MKGKFVFAAAVFAATAALAAPPKVAIKDESFKDAEGHRVLRESVVADASLDAAWKAFTTTAGFTRWAVPSGQVTSGNGGAMEWGFGKDFKAGDPMNVLNRIDIYLPDQLIAWHNEHVPAGGPIDPDTFGKVRSMIAFEAVDATHTKVTQTIVGFGDDAKFDALYQHLRGGNAAYLGMLANSFHETDAEAHAARFEEAIMNTIALRRATIIGTLLQIAMVIAGHYVPVIALHVFMLGGMFISLLAGVIYARSAQGYVSAAIGGAIAGGICALLGIAVSMGLGDTLPIILVVGTVASLVTGLIGGVIGKLVFKSA